MFILTAKTVKMYQNKQNTSIEQYQEIRHKNCQHNTGNIIQQYINELYTLTNWGLFLEMQT